MRHTWFVGILFVLGCTGSTSPGDGLVVTASVDRTVFRAGDTVTVVVTVTNRAMRPRSFQTSSCPIEWFVVTTQDGVEVGPERFDMCLSELRSVTLAPGEHVDLIRRWAGSALRQDPHVPVKLAPGTYLLRGRPVTSAPTRIDPVAIEIIP